MRETEMPIHQNSTKGEPYKFKSLQKEGPISLKVYLRRALYKFKSLQKESLKSLKVYKRRAL